MIFEICQLTKSAYICRAYKRLVGAVAPDNRCLVMYDVNYVHVRLGHRTTALLI